MNNINILIKRFLTHSLTNSKGITLIALVITIIILLILSGITISAITSNNGLLNKTQQAKEKSDFVSALETLYLKINEANIEKERICTLEELEQFLSKEEETEILVTKYNETAMKQDGIGDYQPGELKNIVVNVLRYKKYYFIIEENCTITKISNDYGKTFLEIEKFTNQQESGDVNYDWKKILELAGIDSTNYNSYEEALENKNVIETIISNEESVKILLNSSDDIIQKTLENEEILKQLASNEKVAIEIINNEKWYQKIENSENSSSFFDNVNIAGTEELTFVDDENPYYTFLAKANKSYFIQCYGAQGGSYYNTNPGGYGGYSCGIFKPKQDTTLYIYKGGKGVGSVAVNAIAGGYNGGGSVLRLE